MDVVSDIKALRGVRIVSLAVNLPGPLAAARLRQLGAAVLKVEPPTGDPLARLSPKWYRELLHGQKIVRLNLKDSKDANRLRRFLAKADLLLTSSRKASLERLSLGWKVLHAEFPTLCQVALTGHRSPREHIAGHDLTYQASIGLVHPPRLPNTLLADVAGAERAVSSVMALLLMRQRRRRGSYVEVSLEDIAAAFAKPLNFGITAPGGIFGGGSMYYDLYESSDGWIALAAVEPQFQKKLQDKLGCVISAKQQLTSIFSSRTSQQWQRWAEEHDLPLTAVRAHAKANRSKSP